METLSTSDYELVQCLVKNEFLHADENLVYKAIIAVTRGRIVDEVITDFLILNGLYINALKHCDLSFQVHVLIITWYP